MHKFRLVWSSGMKTCQRLMDVTFRFEGLHHEFRVRVLSLATIGHGMMWQRIQFRSDMIHVRTGLTCQSSHGFTCKSESLQI